jgi:hypothetical protein
METILFKKNTALTMAGGRAVVSLHRRSAPLARPQSFRLKDFGAAAALRLFCIAVSFAGAGALAPSVHAAEAGSDVIGQLLDRIVARENDFLKSIRTRTPLIETYIQETGETGERAPAPIRAPAPTKDHYFLGRFRISDAVAYEPLIERTDGPPRRPGSWLPSVLTFRPPGGKGRGLEFLPRGFAQMAVIDASQFNRQNYNFEYVRREFLGEVRCLVFDVSPVQRQQPGKFVGRIWVEDRDDAIVRFNGTYVQAPPAKGPVQERYFHFDSWRTHVGGALWVPSEIYVEEEGGQARDTPYPRFKAQTRIWDYAAAPSNKLDELTGILIESGSGVRDQPASEDVSPLESQRSWERQAEENLLARLEKGGLLAPAGPVDEVLNTVVNNLLVSARLNIDARCRVLLTTPIETFTAGHTIIISRGLIDVLPDEASLALMIAGELAHIALGHPTQTQFAFNNQTMLSDAALLQRFHFQRPPEEMAEAAKKTIEIMRASPYSGTANAGLFLKALEARSGALTRLLRANLGDQIADADALRRLSEFAESAPPLQEDKLDQIAALPLGSRVKLDPWSNRIELVKAKPVTLLSPREKMPFEVTPFAPFLKRADGKKGP